MALKVKAVERLLKFDKEKEGKYRYVLKPDLYTRSLAGEGHQGGCPPKRCEPRRDAGLLGCSR